MGGGVASRWRIVPVISMISGAQNFEPHSRGVSTDGGSIFRLSSNGGRNVDERGKIASSLAKSKYLKHTWHKLKLPKFEDSPREYMD